MPGDTIVCTRYKQVVLVAGKCLLNQAGGISNGKEL